MWELSTAAVYDKERVEQYLREGYEPFAVTGDVRGERIWFKRVTDEVHSSKSTGSESRRVRKAPAKSKE